MPLLVHHDNEINDWYMSEKVGTACWPLRPVYYELHARQGSRFTPEMLIDRPPSPWEGPYGSGLDPASGSQPPLPGVYERHFAALKAGARQWILEKDTMEAAIRPPHPDLSRRTRRVGFKLSQQSSSGGLSVAQNVGSAGLAKDC